MNAFFVFSGQGAQTVGMGKDLYDNCPEAKAVFDKADQVLNNGLLSVIFEGPIEKLTQSTYCQTAIYTMSCACLAAFQKHHPEVKAVGCAGLSLGEYAAFYAGGAFTFEEGLRLLNERGALIDKACQSTSGSMAAVLNADPAVIKEICAKNDVDVANFNSASQIVISGEKTKLAQTVADLKAAGVRKVIELTVAGAFHSRLMTTAGEGLKKVLADAAIQLPQIPVYQNFTAQTPASVAELKSNLASQVAGSVRWEECVKNMSQTPADICIEFGPGAVLTGLVGKIVPELARYNINSLESLNQFK